MKANHKTRGLVETGNGVEMSEPIAGAKRDIEQLVLDYWENPRPDLKDIIILQCSGLVERIARRFSGIEPVDDLTQVGYIGLLNALSKFDPHAGVKFNTYATHLVAGEIKHYLRDRSQIIRHPAWVQEMRQRLNKAVTTLQAELGRAPSEREIAEASKLSEQSVRELIATQELLKVTSLDVAPSDESDGDSEIDKLESLSPCAAQVSVEDRVVLEDAMSQLRDMEREVLTKFHFDSLNQTEIAAELGISCNYVSHILRQSLTKLRKILSSEEEADRMLRKDLDHSTDILDSETKSYSEEYFMSRLTEEAHRATGTDDSVAIMIVKFQGLQAMQSFYGDASVSEFLQDAADFLRSTVRSLDVVCRYGKTGFGLILPGAHETAALVRVRLEKRFAQWMVGRSAGHGGLVAKLGYAIGPVDGKSARDLLAVATDRAKVQDSKAA